MIRLLSHHKNRNFLRLWLAQIISQFGDRIHQMALIGLIAERSFGSTMGLAKLMAFTILPVFIIQPFAGVFVDRWNHRTTLFVCDFLRGLIVLSIPLTLIFRESMIPIYIVVFLVFCLSRFYVPAKMSIIPDLVEGKDLLLANSLVTTTGMIAIVFGAAFGGFIIEAWGARTGFMIDAFTYFVAALLLFSMGLTGRLKMNKETIVQSSKNFIKEEKNVWQEIKEGFVYLCNHKEIRFIINTVFILYLAAGATYVVIIVFIQEAFASVTKDFGMIAASLGVGLFLGAVTYGKIGKSFIWYKTIFCSLFLTGLLLIIFALFVHFFKNIALTMGIGLCLGVVIGPIIIEANTMIQKLAPEEMRGKAFSALEIVIHFAFLVSMMLSSWASLYIDKVWILVFVGVIISVISVIGIFKNQNLRGLASDA